MLIEHTLISSHFETVRTSVSTALGRAGYLKNNKYLVSQVELKSDVFALCRSLFVDNFNMFGRFDVLSAMHVWLMYIRIRLAKAVLANRTTAQRSPDDQIIQGTFCEDMSSVSEVFFDSHKTKT